MRRRDRKKKKRQNQPQEQQAPQVQHDNEGDGEEIGHEVKHEAAASVVSPAEVYRYNQADIDLLTKALKATNHAIHYLRKEELSKHSDIILLLQAMQDGSNCLDKIWLDNFDEELRQHKQSPYAFDRLVTVHARGIRLLLASIPDDRGHLLEWAKQLRKLSIKRITQIRFKEIEDYTEDPKEQAALKREALSQLIAVPEMNAVTSFNLPLPESQFAINSEYDSTLMNIFDAITVIQRISVEVQHNALTRPIAAVISAALMVVVENMKKLPANHELRAELYSFNRPINDFLRVIKGFNGLRNNCAHNTDIDRYVDNPVEFVETYLKPFQTYHTFVCNHIEALPKLLPRIVAEVEPAIVAAMEEDGGQSYKVVHDTIFAKLREYQYLNEGVEPQYKEDGKVFDDEELQRAMVIAIVYERKDLFELLLGNPRSCTNTRVKSLLNTPLSWVKVESLEILMGVPYAQKRQWAIFYRLEGSRYFRNLEINEMVNREGLERKVYPAIKSVYLLELAVKCYLTELHSGKDDVGTSFMERLLELGASPNIDVLTPDSTKPMRPLVYYAKTSDRSCMNDDLLRFLLDRGANPRLPNAALLKSTIIKRPTEIDFRILKECGLDLTKESITIDADGCTTTTNIIGYIQLVADSSVDDQEACRLVLMVVRLIASRNGMSTIDALLKDTFSIKRNGQIYKTKLIDSINFHEDREPSKKLLNILSELASNNNELFNVVVTNDLKAIRRFFIKNSQKLDDLMEMKLNYISDTKVLERIQYKKLSPEEQTQLITAASNSITDPQVRVMCTNYCKDYNPGFWHKGNLQIRYVRQEKAVLTFSGLVELFCDANVAEQVIAWSKHGVGKAEAAVPALELKNDEMKVLVAAGENKPTVSEVVSIETRMKDFFKAVLEEAAAKAEEIMPYKTITTLNIAGGSAGVEPEAHDGSLMPLGAAATKVETVEERAAAEVSFILSAAAKAIIADRASAADDASHASAQILATPKLMGPPTQAPTPAPTLSPTVVSSEVPEMPRIDDSALEKLYKGSEDELPNSESVPTTDPYIPIMMSLSKAHHTVRIVGSLLDTGNMINNPNVNTVTRAAMGYGHIAEILLEKNLGMKYLTVAVITYQYFQGDSWGAIKSTMMLAGRTLPAALMPIAPVPALVIEGLFICYDTYGVAQDLKELIGSQTQMSDESWEL